MRVAVLVFGICALACAVGHAAILLSVIRSRASAPDAPVPRPRLGVEVVWAILPAIALVVLLTVTWSHVRDHARTRPGVVMKVAG